MPENSQSTNPDDHGTKPPSEEPGSAFKAMEEMMARLQQTQAEMAPVLEALDQRLRPLLEDLHAQATPMLKEVEQQLGPFFERLEKMIQEVTASPAPGDGEAKTNEDRSAG